MEDSQASRLDKDPTANEQLHALTSVLLARADLLAHMGKSYGTQRDIFSSLGYELVPTFTSYWWRYKRTSIGKRVVQAYPKACWRKPPQVQEDQEAKQTLFEEEWEKLIKDFRLWKIFKRADILAGIGTYGILYLGFSGEIAQPLAKGEKLLFLRPFTSDAATVGIYDTDESSPRYGLPLTYKIQMDAVTGQAVGRGVTREGRSGITKEVHYSRVIHIAEDIEEGEIFGTPRMEACLNDLQSLDYVVGGSGEMFWRGAFPGHAFIAKDGMQLPNDPTRKQAFEQEIGDYVHGLKRYMKLSGMDIHDFTPQAVSPKDHYDVLISNISTATGIPKRILSGSERGELASTQDRDNWADQVAERQKNFCETDILMPFIGAMLFTGVLPEPEEELSVYWPPIQAPNQQEMAATAKAVAEALNTYAAGPAESVMPLSVYFKRYLDFTVAEMEDLEQQLEENPPPEPKEVAPLGSSPEEEME